MIFSQQSVSPSATTLMRYSKLSLGIDSFVTFLFFGSINIIVSSKQQQQQEEFLRVSRVLVVGRATEVRKVSIM